MRAIALVALLLPLPALADQITATSKITAVTAFPAGAQITREVTFTAPAGTHELLVTDLPAATVPEMIRLGATPTLGLGAFGLRTDRLPPRDDLTSPALVAAKGQVESWEAREREAQAAVDAILIRVEAADAKAAFLVGISVEGDALTAEGLTAMADAVGNGVLAARQIATAARVDLPAAQKTLERAQEGLAKARAAEEAVLTGSDDYAALTVAVTLAAPGTETLTVTHYVADAGWEPVYDLMLSREGTPALTVKRGVLVRQYSGEDWRGVDLTLSTAQPVAQASPTQLWPELRQIVDPAKEAEMYARKSAAEPEGFAADMAEPIMEAAPVQTTALAGFEGDTVVYHYPAAVDVASGVENLRLALDEKSFAAKVIAQAVPRHDSTAYLMAKFANDSGEILLPGTAYLFREGVLVGGSMLEILAPGADTEVAFGAIEGLRLRRDMPERAEGDRGILTTSTQREETAVLEVENLTNEAWPVRLLDQVPYSEQEDLEVSLEADPAPTETDVEGQRGILAWEFEIAPGEKKAVTLTHTLSWPEGMELR